MKIIFWIFFFNKTNNNSEVQLHVFFIVIFLNKYKLLDHYNASTALDVL